MTSRGFHERLLRRARKANIVVAPDTADRLEAYYRLLARWSNKINLTAFSLAELNDQAVDRLLIEPLVASRFVPESPKAALTWFDLGSGGGSPAIPLKTVRPATWLTMVESKTRKVAFLREAVRSLELFDTVVEHARVEDMAERPEVHGKAHLITVRGVRIDSAFLDAIATLLTHQGQLFLFASEAPRAAATANFSVADTAKLADSPSSHLVILRRV